MCIRDSDWPAPGVQFRDITPLLQNPRVFRVLIDAFVHRYMDPAVRPDVVAGLDARGFILGAVVAYELNVGFVPIRKKGKLPFTTVEETYELEYGSATVELHTDAVHPVSYTHLDVYKRQVLLSLSQAQGLVPPALMNPILASMVLSMLATPFIIMFSNRIVMKPVSYTHLDVYKRQIRKDLS